MYLFICTLIVFTFNSLPFFDQNEDEKFKTLSFKSAAQHTMRGERRRESFPSQIFFVICCVLYSISCMCYIANKEHILL